MIQAGDKLADALDRASETQREQINRIVPIGRLRRHDNLANVAGWVQREVAGILQAPVGYLFDTEPHR